jgi:hypothetical protein
MPSEGEKVQRPKAHVGAKQRAASFEAGGETSPAGGGLIVAPLSFHHPWPAAAASPSSSLA